MVHHPRRHAPSIPLATFLASLTLTGCLGGGDGGDESTAVVQPPPTSQSVTGSVLAAPVQDANVRLSDRNGATAAETRSDSEARYATSVTVASDRYPLTVTATGGTDILRAVAPEYDLVGSVMRPGDDTVANVNPFSTVAVEIARNLSGGISASNLSTAENTVIRELNTGLAAGTRPMSTPVDAGNLSEVVKASVTLDETVRRVQEQLTTSGRPATANSVVRSIAADLVDGVVDGVGANGVDTRTAALTVVVLAETLLETMQNDLWVDGLPVASDLEEAMLAVSPSGYDTALDELTINDDMLATARTGIVAAMSVAPSAELDGLLEAIDSLRDGMTAGMIRPFVADNYRDVLRQATSDVANGSDAEIATVNRVARNGGESPDVANSPPAISGSPPTSVQAGTAYSFAPSASDSDADPLTFSVSGLPSWASFNATTGLLSGTPGSSDVGDYTGIVITVTDGEATTSLPAFSVTVTEPASGNAPPTISGDPATIVAIGDAYSFTPSASDPDGDALTFSITRRPGWAGFDPATGRLSGTPQTEDRGDYTGIIISVSDGQATAELAPFTITVSIAGSGNTPPTISGSPSLSVQEDSPYRFTPTASDADGDTLTFSIQGRPAWATFEPSTGTLSGAPAVGDAGDYPGIQISVSDGQATESLPTFSITVTALGANAPPEISGTPATTVEVGSEYLFTPTASDPDGDTLTFSIEGLPAWADFDTTTGTLSGTPSPGDENVYGNIVISVSDGEFTASLATFSIEVVAQSTGTGSATLSWTAPTQNEDGSALTDLAGYRLYWGTTQGSYPNSQPIDNPSVTTYTIDGLASGTYYFVATAINEAGVESRYSGVATKVVP